MPSTNTFAKNLLSKTTPTHGTVIITGDQTEGRGQGDHRWEVQPGKNLTCSIIYDTSFLPAAKQYYLNMAVALAVQGTLSTYIEDKAFLIKWPNDILCGDRKVAGILIENTLRGSYLHQSVIGIGVNINQRDFQGLPGATSLSLLADGIFSIGDVLNTLCQQVERYYLQLTGGKMEEVRAAYNELLYRKGLPTEWGSNDGILRGTPLEVHPDGRLEADVNGESAYFRFGEIRWPLEGGINR